VSALSSLACSGLSAIASCLRFCVRALARPIEAACRSAGPLFDLPERVPFLILSGAALVMVVLLFRRHTLGAEDAALLILASAVALMFAVEGRRTLRYIRRIGPVEMQVWQDAVRIGEVASVLPRLPELRPESGWLFTHNISSEQRWSYELGSNLLFHMRHLAINPDDLTKREREQYRGLVMFVARIALNDGDTHKALDLLRSIGPDQRTFEETFLLGLAHLRLAEGESDELSRRPAFGKVREVLESAKILRPTDAWARFALAYAYDELKMYDLAIAENKEAMRLEADKFFISGQWNIAVSLLKQGNSKASMAALEEIPAGKWWVAIDQDPELAALAKDERFRQHADSPTAVKWAEAIELVRKGDKPAALAALEQIPKGVWWAKIETDAELAALKDGEPFRELIASRRILT
jgi:tetratricopeptide (TPR) repeat protein